MGSVLEPIGRIGRDIGTTVLLTHHFRKGAGQDDSAEPCSLEDLSQAGVAEWARQWLLLQRREPYANDGRHALWLRTGGSAGHGGLWAVDVGEGLLDPDTWSGRKWDVTVTHVSDAREAAKADRENRRAAAMERTDGANVDKLVAALRQFPDGETAKRLRAVARLDPDGFERALSWLERDGRVEHVTVVKSRGKYDGFRLR